MRIDAVVTATYAVTVAAPFVTYMSLRFVRSGRHEAHRLTQSVLLVMGWLAVLVLEARIRYAGGSGAFISEAPDAVHVWARTLLLVHVGIAVATYALWTWLAIVSWRRYSEQLPGSFSRRHRRVGTIVFGGLCFTAASATGMYVLAFVV